MSRDRTWAQIIYEYNSDQSVDYVYVECEGKSPEANLKYCPVCGFVFERRYEQNIKKTVVYRYSTLFRRAIPEERYECCNSRDCKCDGDDYAFNC